MGFIKPSGSGQILQFPYQFQVTTAPSNSGGDPFLHYKWSITPLALPDFEPIKIKTTDTPVVDFDMSGMSIGSSYYIHCYYVYSKGSLTNSVHVGSLSFTAEYQKPEAPIITSPSGNPEYGTRKPTFTIQNYSGSGYVSLVWYEIYDSSGQIYYSTTWIPVVNSFVSPVDLPTNKQLYLRVKYKNTHKESDWSVPAGFKTIISIPTIPYITSPYSSTTNQPTNLSIVGSVYSGYGSLLESQWRVSSSGNMITPVYNELDPFDSYYVLNSNTLNYFNTLPLLTGTTYWVSLRYRNEKGWSSWSEPINFTTRVSIPNPPSFLSVTENTNKSIRVILNNYSGDGTHSGTKYSIYMFDSISSTVPHPFIGPITLGTVTQFNTEILSTETKYRVFVSYQNEAGWSSESYYDIIISKNVPNTPINISPINNYFDAPLEIALYCSKFSGDGTFSGLQWQVSTSISDWSTLVYSSSIYFTNQANTAYYSNLITLEPGTTYYWRVRHQNEVGYSNWSTPSVFRTEEWSTPDAPVITSITEGETNISRTPTILGSVYSDPNSNPHVMTDWEISNASSGAIVWYSYRDITNLESITVGTNLPEYTNLRVRVRYYNGGKSSSWSTPVNFRTIPIAPNKPINSIPGINSIDIELTPLLVGSSYSNNTPHISSDWEVSDNISFDPGNIVFSSYSDTVNKTNISINQTLTRNTSYWWRVRYTNSTGDSSWSTATKFTTIINIPVAPTLSSPGDAETGVSQNPTLQTGTYSGDGSHINTEWVIAVDLNFENIVWRRINSASTSVTVNTNGTFTSELLKNNTKLNSYTVYYWRARYTNKAGESSWSTPRSFQTLQIEPDKPSGISPFDFERQVLLDSGLRSSNYSGDGAHISSDWEIRDQDNDLIWSDINDSTNLEAVELTDGEFVEGTDEKLQGDPKPGTNEWLEVAPKLGTETRIQSLVVLNGKLYGGTAASGKLYEWNGEDTWTEVAAQLGAETYIWDLAVFNNKIYGGTSPNGKLYEWNGTDAWVEVAGKLGSETYIYSLAVFNNKLYGGTRPNGKLYEWNGTDAWVEVAGKFGSETYIYSLVVYDNNLYGGTGQNGKLFKWNGTNAWTEVAPKLGDETQIWSLDVLNNKIYGGTSPNGKLYEWNGTDAWIEVAPKFEDETWILDTAVFDNKIYGGTYPNGKLVEWNGTDAWVEVAPKLGAETYIFSLAMFNNRLYGGTGLNGKLYKWNGTGEDPTGSLLNDKWYFYRMRYKNDQGDSEWSNLVAFHSIVLVHSQPTITNVNNDNIQISNFVLNSSEFLNDQGFGEHFSSDWELSDNINFTTKISESQTDTTNLESWTVPVTLNKNTIYYARVRYRNESGASSWSPIFQFTTIVPAPRRPLNISPLNGTIQDWESDIIIQSSGYSATENPQTKPHLSSDWEVSTDESFGIIIWSNYNSESNKITSSIPELSLNSETEYFWRVRHNNIGGNSSWSIPTSFKTLPNYPDKPAIYYPAEGSTEIPRENGIIKASKYVGEGNHSESQWEVYGINYFIQPFTYECVWRTKSTEAENYLIETIINNTVGDFIGILSGKSQLDYFKDYKFRVRYKNEKGYSEWSEYINAKSTFDIPNIAVGISPIEDSMNVQIYPELQASQYSGHGTHIASIWEVATDSAFNNIVWEGNLVQNSLGTNDLTKIIVNDVNGFFKGSLIGKYSLNFSSKYYWRVAYKNEIGYSFRSSGLSFTTKNYVQNIKVTADINKKLEHLIDRFVHAHISKRYPKFKEFILHWLRFMDKYNNQFIFNMTDFNTIKKFYEMVEIFDWADEIKNAHFQNFMSDNSLEVLQNIYFGGDINPEILRFFRSLNSRKGSPISFQILMKLLGYEIIITNISPFKYKISSIDGKIRTLEDLNKFMDVIKLFHPAGMDYTTEVELLFRIIKKTPEISNNEVWVNNVMSTGYILSTVRDSNITMDTITSFLISEPSYQYIDEYKLEERYGFLPHDLRTVQIQDFRLYPLEKFRVQRDVSIYNE